MTSNDISQNATQHGRGIDHTDDRTPLAFAYEGDELIAKLYKMTAVVECEEASWMTVVRTPEGENRAY